MQRQDIVELLTEALRSKEIPRQPICPQFDDKRHTYIGKMPTHLRALYVLNRKISKRNRHPGSYHLERMLQDTLEEHYLSISGSDFSEIRIYADWIVGGILHRGVARRNICGLSGIADLRPTEFYF